MGDIATNPKPSTPAVPNTPVEEEYECCCCKLRWPSLIIGLLFVILLAVFIFFAGMWFAQSRMQPTQIISPIPVNIR